MAFTANWFQSAFQSEYAEVYQHRDLAQVAREVRFAKGALEIGPDDRILDLACGEGRHSRILIEEGFDVCGCDYSLDLLRKAHSSSSDGFARHIHWCDMRSLPYPNSTFDRVLNFFTSFGYFESDSENQDVLVEVRRVLRQGGLFLLDFFNVPRVRKELRPFTEREINGLRIRERRAFVASTRRLEKKVWIAGEGIERSYTESVRAYNQAELTNLLIKVGFKVNEYSGNFAADRYSERSERLIIVAEAS